jgi:hypothetical protein
MVSIVLEDPDAQPLGDEPVYVGDAHNTRVELDIAGERFAGRAGSLRSERPANAPLAAKRQNSFVEVTSEGYLSWSRTQRTQSCS